MTKHFTHLHVHTEYSLLDGAIRVNDLVRHAKEQEWKAVGISDHGNIFGAVKFFQQAQKEGVKPVLGCEMYFTPDVKEKKADEKYFHLILIVQNEAGYKNLCRLMALAHQEGFYFKPRIDYAMLEKHSEGLAVTTACLGGHIPKLLRHGNIEEAESRIKWFKDLFGKDRFFFELQPGEFEKQRDLNKLLIEQSAKWDVPLIATSDSHYMSLADHDAHEVLLSVQTKGVLSNPKRYTFGDCRCFIRSTQQMLDAFPEHPEAIWNTGKIADSCEFAFEFGKLFFPKSPIPALPEYKEKTEAEKETDYFKKICHEGLETLKQENRVPKDQYEIYDARLKEETDLIIKMGFIGYFLVVSDFIKWAKQKNIPVGPGRGSAAGSLVAWALEITNVDPIRYNLLFERFLNPERVTMPDIDIDFCVQQREDVINYVKEKYGHDCVCQIITFGTMMAKGVIKDVARVLELPFQDANAITDMIPNQLKITLKEALEQEPRLQEMIDSNPKVKQIFDIALKLEGLTRHASKHAAGLVISPTPLAETLPLYIPPKTNDLVAQYAMTGLESVGFLKMGFLGLKNLTVIDRALKSIKKNYNVDIDLDTLPLDDKEVFELIGRGETNAIFQFESEGLKDVLRKLKPNKFEDLIAVNALYRPGPLGAGMVDDFIERRHGRQPVTYLFPELEPILLETYGVIVYQEQVMKIASAIAGYTLGASDILRRAMGKKKVEVMAEQKELFVKGAKERNFDVKKAEELFDLMAYFAGYGFNKSHSTAYALIAYHTAYLKTHYPNEFMAASVSFETNNPDQLTHYLQEINDMGLTITPPDINKSQVEFSASSDGILFGLEGIKNVGTTALQNIIEKRAEEPFKDLLDFCKRVDLRTVNKRVIESLIYAGATDSFIGNRAQKMAELETIINQAVAYKKQQETGQMGLFDLGGAPATASSNVNDLYAFQPREEWPTKEKLAKEKEVAGFYLSSHPLKSYPAVKWIEVESFEKTLEKIKTVTSLKEPFVACVGLKSSFREITTKKGDRMAFLQLEDLKSHGEIVIFPKLYAKVSHLLDEHDIFVVKGALDIGSENKCKIKANELIPVEQLFEDVKAIQHVTIKLSGTVEEEKIKKLREKLPQGTTPLRIAFSENSENLVLQSSKKVSCNAEVLQAIEKMGTKIRVAV